MLKLYSWKAILCCFFLSAVAISSPAQTSPMPNPSKHNCSSIEPGLCALCRHARRIQSDRGSVFYQCQRSRTDPDFALYPRLPVEFCRGFEAAPPDTRSPRS
jgi:hypothetical protein